MKLQDAQGIIYYELRGIEKCWEVSAHPTRDNPESLKRHYNAFHGHLKDRSFIGAELWKINKATK